MQSSEAEGQQAREIALAARRCFQQDRAHMGSHRVHADVEPDRVLTCEASDGYDGCSGGAGLAQKGELARTCSLAIFTDGTTRLSFSLKFSYIPHLSE